MSIRLVLALASILPVLPAAGWGEVFPCSLAGMDEAVAAGGGPHALDCTPADTIVVPASRGGISITGDLALDLGGVSIAFESVARGRLGIGPSVQCAASCVRGPTAVELRDFTLRGALSIHTSNAFDPPGSIDATIAEGLIRAPPNRHGGIAIGGPNTHLHLLDSTLDGNDEGIRVKWGASATIERSLIANTAASALVVPYNPSPFPEWDTYARVVNSTLSNNGWSRGDPAINGGGRVDLESSTIVASDASDVVYHTLNLIPFGLSFRAFCGHAELTLVNTLIRGTCTICGEGRPLRPTDATSFGGNVETGDGCNLDHPTDQVDVSDADLALGPLENENGTHALLEGSVAIDAGVGCPPPAEDQRGAPRPQGGGCDVGAYERTSVLEVGLDVGPRRRDDRIHPLSPREIHVAILGSDAFDVREVDDATLAFGPDGAEPVRRGQRRTIRVEDVNRDAHEDLVARFRVRDAGIAFGDTAACLTGGLGDGTPFEGCDAIRTWPERLGECGRGFELALLPGPLVWLRRRLRLAA